MLRWRTFWSLLAVYLAVAASCAIGSASLLAARHRAALFEQYRQRLYGIAAVLRDRATAAVAEPSAEATADLQRLADELGVATALAGPDGASMTRPGGTTAPAESLPEVVEATRNGFGVSIGESASGTESRMFAALRLGTADAPAGYLVLSTPWEPAEAEVAAMRRWVAGVVGVVGAILFALAGAWSARLTRRLAVLTQAAREAAGTDEPRDAPASGGQGFDRLSAAVDSLSVTLTSRIETLQRERARLEKSEEQLRTVLGSMVEGVVAVDNAERVLFANRAARGMLDFVGSNPVGRPIWETVRNPTIQQVVRSVLETRRQSTAEFEVPRTQSVVAMIAAPLSGEPCPGAVLVLHDVTELRRLENLRREFVSNVSHELKTPLTAIQAYTETLLGGAVDDVAISRRFLQSIEEQADRLHELILDLLRLARIESGQNVYEVASVPLGASVTDCLEAHAEFARSKGIDLRGEPPPEPISVLADPEALRTILDNLLTNALKYTPAGGRVVVEWSREGERARIDVRDTGIGIPPKHHARIFERFYRVDKARARDEGGTGLGLSIVKHLVQVFGGSVDVESEPGRGSTFTVHLPLAECRAFTSSS